MISVVTSVFLWSLIFFEGHWYWEQTDGARGEGEQQSWNKQKKTWAGYWWWEIIFYSFMYSINTFSICWNVTFDSLFCLSSFPAFAKGEENTAEQRTSRKPCSPRSTMKVSFYFSPFHVSIFMNSFLFQFASYIYFLFIFYRHWILLQSVVIKPAVLFSAFITSLLQSKSLVFTSAFQKILTAHLST